MHVQLYVILFQQQSSLCFGKKHNEQIILYVVAPLYMASDNL